MYYHVLVHHVSLAVPNACSGDIDGSINVYLAG